MKKKFNAARALKDFDPSKSPDPRIVKDFMRVLKYSQADWDAYHQVKNSFPDEDEWRQKRSAKHAKMARDYAKAFQEAENKL